MLTAHVADGWIMGFTIRLTEILMNLNPYE